jgi:type VI secretion system secreted protein VgrG
MLRLCAKPTISLAPGLSLRLEAGANYEGAVRPEGEHLVIALDHRWRADAPRYELEVTAIPLAVPYRLPRVTPRPRIAGLHSAVVTGPAGQEIHADAAGRVKVRFFWDREGATDDKSSLPVRVAQPNLPGSMLLPRVGWEVMVAFEDGDPDRPLIVGRAYNAKHPPPFALPANKTITNLGTASSPGGKSQNAVHFDDAAGRSYSVARTSVDRIARIVGTTRAKAVDLCMLLDDIGVGSLTIYEGNLRRQPSRLLPG